MTSQVLSPMRAPRPIARPGSGSPTSAQGGITGKDVLRIIRSRIWLIIIVTILTTIFSVGLWYILKIKVPRFTSEGFIGCKMPTGGIFGARILPRKEVIGMETASQAAILHSEAFLSKILLRRKVRETVWFKKRESDPSEALKDIQSSFGVNVLRDTEYIKVSMSCSSAEESQIILDEILNTFRIHVKQKATGTLSATLKAVKAERNKVGQSMKNYENKIKGLGTTIGIPGWRTGGKGVIDHQAKNLKSEEMRLVSEYRKLQMEEGLLKQEIQSGNSPTIMAEVENNRMILGYNQQLTIYRQDYERLLRGLGSEHRQVKEYQLTIRSLSDQMSQLTSQLTRQYSTQLLSIYDHQKKAIRQELAVIAEQYDDVRMQQSQIEQMMITYDTTETEIKKLAANLALFEKQINEINVEMRGTEGTRAEIVQEATLPLRRSFPMLGMFLPAGIILGLMFSMGIAFLLEFLDDSVKSPQDVIRFLNVPLLGMVPEYDEDDLDDVCVEKIAETHPHILMSEFYRQVRTNLFFSAPEDELKTILVTSSSAGCGKTTTAVNLAITFALEGKRILLVDANFRRPALNHLFPAEGRPRGLSNILVGQVSASDVIRASSIEGLDLVDSGPLPPNPADLLNSQRMRDFLASQKQYYDHIIIDGPPVLIVVDARILANLVDGTMLVVYAEQTPRGMVQRMIRELQNGKVKVLGVLLNAVRSRKGGYFQKTYRSYYDYTTVEPAMAGALPGGDEEKDSDKDESAKSQKA